MSTMWSVAVAAEGDREFTREEIVELADAVTQYSGIASGIGSTRFGATLLVDADSREEAVERGQVLFAAAAKTAGLPACPVVHVEATGEHEAPDGDEA